MVNRVNGVDLIRSSVKPGCVTELVDNYDTSAVVIPTLLRK
jgi:hypothetical protein